MMKRSIFVKLSLVIACVLMLSVSGFVYAANPFIVKDVAAPSDKIAEVKSPKVIKIDGLYEEIWDRIDPIPIQNIAWGTEGATGNFKIFWDNEYLYVLVDVTDTTPDTLSDRFTRQDCVEIFVNETNSKGMSYSQGDCHFKVNRDGIAEYGHNASEENINYRLIKKDDGYMVEAAILFTKIEPQYGTEIGFDVKINDSQGNQNRDFMTQWSDTSMETFVNLTRVGTVTLK